MESTAPVRPFGAHIIDRKPQPMARLSGGNSVSSQHIIQLFPSRHRLYVEPFGGADSLLLYKPRSAAEVYNDTDRDVINLFQVMRDPLSLVRLIDGVHWTPLARDEFLEAAQDADDAIEQARRMLLRSWAALRCSRANRWAEFADGRSRALPRRLPLPSVWSSVPEALRRIAARLTGVVIENRDPCKVIGEYDSPQTLFYVAPPWLTYRRCAGNRKPAGVACTEANELAMVKTLVQVRGHVVLRGGDFQSCRDLLVGWQKVRLSGGATGTRRLAETIWLSPGIAEAHRIATNILERRP